MKLRLCALLLAAAAPALGASTDTVRRGNIVVHVDIVVHATGTVVPDGVFRLKSTITGRVESVNASSGSWHVTGKPLATLAVAELAAMIDSRGTDNQNVLEDRWSKVYRLTKVSCPAECYVLKVFAKAKAWVKPQAVLFEAASGLNLVGWVDPETAPAIRNGMNLTFWAVKNPHRRLTARIARFGPDVRGDQTAGSMFSIPLSPDCSLDPGTEWEGEIAAAVSVLTVPAAALIVHDGVAYLPARASTTPELMWGARGAEDKREIPILNDSQFLGEARHAPPPYDESPPRLREPEAPPEAPAAKIPRTGAETPEKPAPPQAQPSTLTEPDNKDYGGEDPYGQQ